MDSLVAARRVFAEDQLRAFVDDTAKNRELLGAVGVEMVVTTIRAVAERYDLDPDRVLRMFLKAEES